MLVQDFLRIVSNTNLPIVGLVVIVGSSFAILLYVIVEKLLQLALRLFDVTTDAIASCIVHLPSATLTTQEETPLVPRSLSQRPISTFGHIYSTMHIYLSR
eukprot:scaffold12748_cov112-Skeletonema_dohrnii-CCMP3373.AAC.1